MQNVFPNTLAIYLEFQNKVRNFAALKRKCPND